jgi:hypothetical protein
MSGQALIIPKRCDFRQLRPLFQDKPIRKRKPGSTNLGGKFRTEPVMQFQAIPVSLDKGGKFDLARLQDEKGK